MKWLKEFLKKLGTQESSPTSNFTPRAQQVLALARKEADRFNHNYIGTEHVLLGLIALGRGVAVNVLTGLGLNLENIRAEIEKQTGIGLDEKSTTPAPYTPRVKKVLELARREAKNLNHTYIGTEHLLLGLLREGDGIAAQVLRNLGADIEQVRIAVLKELDPNLIPEALIQTPVKPNSRLLNIRDWAGRDFGEGFTPRAIQVIFFARQEADRLHLNYLGTEHLLLGLIALGNGVACNVLKSLGLNLENVRPEVEKLACGTGDKQFGDIQYTPRMKSVLKWAKEEAKALNHTYIGTEHLLLGLLRENEGPATEIFKTFEVDMYHARITILKELDPNFGHH